MNGPILRRLAWAPGVKKDFKRFPVDVRRNFGFSLFQAQSGSGGMSGAKPLAGGLLEGLGVVELVHDFDGDTYRAVYTAKIGAVIVVLHAFKKKSMTGIATPRHDVELIRARYRSAVAIYANLPESRR
jgi:phage-related protein